MHQMMAVKTIICIKNHKYNVWQRAGCDVLPVSVIAPFFWTKESKWPILFFCCRYAGYCPQVKFRHYGATFGNATAKCFQDRRTAELNTSVMTKPGVSKDGRDRFPTMYSNSPDLLLSTIAIKRGRWCNAKNYSLFNEHKRGREVKEFDKVPIFTSPFLHYFLMKCSFCLVSQTSLANFK